MAFRPIKNDKKPAQRKHTVRSSSIKTGRSLPVDRYYTPRKDTASVRGGEQQLYRRIPRATRSLARLLLRTGGVIAIGLVVAFNTGLFSVGVKIQYMGSDDVAFRAGEEYRQAVEDVLSSSLLHRSKLTFNSASFEAKVQESFPELSGVVAVVPLVGTRVQVGLQVAEVAARLRSGSVSGLIGTDGRILTDNATPQQVGNYLDTPLLEVVPALDQPVGAQILTEQEVELMRLLVSEFDGSNADRPLLKQLVHDISKRQFEASFIGVDYRVRMTSEREARAQVGSAVATIADLSRQGRVPQEYIDVRVTGRVFIK